MILLPPPSKGPEFPPSKEFPFPSGLIIESILENPYPA
jgi:hypothetical protein